MMNRTKQKFDFGGQVEMFVHVQADSKTTRRKTYSKSHLPSSKHLASRMKIRTSSGPCRKLLPVASGHRAHALMAESGIFGPYLWIQSRSKYAWNASKKAQNLPLLLAALQESAA
jgi:hypothetical protein